MTTEEMWEGLTAAGWTRRGPGSWHWKDPLSTLGQAPRLPTPQAFAVMLQREAEEAERERKQKARRTRKTPTDG